MKGVYRFLIELVGARYAPVLSLVLDPAFDDEAFDDPARLLDIFPNIPADGTVALSGRPELADIVEKLGV